jgi:fibronectin-binding autotransporter adhesin
MHDKVCARFPAVVGFSTLLAAATLATAQSLTWGVNGAGGSGNWDTTTADWFNGSQNVVWSSNGNAIFGGAAGGTVSSFFPGPLVASMTFNTPGYVIQGGQIQTNSSGLTVATNVDATIGSTLSGSLVKNGPAALILNGTIFVGIQVNQGEFRIAGTSSPVVSSIVLANAADAAVTFAQTNSSAAVGLLMGGGTTGGIIRPDNQPRTVTLNISNFSPGNMTAASFGGVLEDNGSGVLAMNFNTGLAGQFLTNANTYSGPTAVTGGGLGFSGNGSALNSSSFSIAPSATLFLDDSGAVVGDRLSDTSPISDESGTILLRSNSSVPVEEKLGQLTITGVPKVTIQLQSAAAARLTFAGIQRIGHATLTISGPSKPDVAFAGVSNGPSGIAPPYITINGGNWATVGADGRLTLLTTYASDINSGVATDNVKLTAIGTTTLAAATTRGSLYLQNSNTTNGQILDLSGNNLELTSGGILSNTGSSFVGGTNSAIQNGSLSTASQEVVATVNNNLTIQSAVIDGNGSTALTKSGGAPLRSAATIRTRARQRSCRAPSSSHRILTWVSDRRLISVGAR